MLSNWILSLRVYIFSQNGFYLDFIYKKVAEIFIRNFLIYGAQFFGEKYLIEFLTKNIFNNFLNKIYKIFNQPTYLYESFFFNIIFLVFIIFISLQIYFIFL